MCKYFLTGNCRYGSSCKLNHSLGGRRSFGECARSEDQSAASSKKLLTLIIVIKSCCSSSSSGLCHQFSLSKCYLFCLTLAAYRIQIKFIFVFQPDPQLTDGRPYQWQINDGKGWRDVENDHIIEAQYSLPHTKSIKIYNTSYG